MIGEAKKGVSKEHEAHAKHIKVKALVLLIQVTDTNNKQGISQHGPWLHPHQVFT